MTQDLDCTRFKATIGLATYCLGFGLTPLLTASLSEEFGRMPMYIVSGVGFTLTHLMVALYVPQLQYAKCMFLLSLSGHKTSTPLSSVGF
jgi:MFS family permease